VEQTTILIRVQNLVEIAKELQT